MKKESEQILKNLAKVNSDNEFIVNEIARIFRIESERKVGRGKFNIWELTAKDNLRPVMGCVYHDNGFRVASDGYLLAVVKSDYPSEYEGKCLNRNGVFVEGKYPKYRSVLCDIHGSYRDGHRYSEQSVDFGKLDDAVQEMKAQKKLLGKEFDTVYAVKIGDAFYKIEHFAKAAKFMQEFGSETIFANEVVCGQVFAGENRLAIMPLNKPCIGDQYKIIDITK